MAKPTGNDAKVLAALKQQYGEKGGEAVYYAMKNKKELPSQKGQKGYKASGTNRGNKPRKDAPKKTAKKSK